MGDEKDDDQQDEEPEEQPIDPEYRIWKKNAAYLYELLVTSNSDWPYLTCEWLPGVVQDEKGSGGQSVHTHQLVLGTQTDGSQMNQLLISRVTLPNFNSAKLEHQDQLESGCYGVLSAKIETFIKINHRGDLNRARYSPFNPFVIATRSSDGNVYLFDYSKQPSEPETKDNFRPELTLIGDQEDGFGLEWNPCVSGRLLSCSIKGKICLYDINSYSSGRSNDSPNKNSSITALSLFQGHHKSGSAINDVSWHCFHTNLFTSASDDCSIVLWDDRLPSDRSSVLHRPQAHSKEVLCLANSPFNPYLLASGGSDGVAVVWDYRNLNHKLHTFQRHTDEIYQLQWSPEKETVFATGGVDKRVMVWDMSLVQSNKGVETEKPPPELLFVHGGHIDRITDFSFNANDPWLVASVADDNSVMIWKMGEDFHKN